MRRNIPCPPCATVPGRSLSATQTSYMLLLPVLCLPMEEHQQTTCGSSWQRCSAWAVQIDDLPRMAAIGEALDCTVFCLPRALIRSCAHSASFCLLTVLVIVLLSLIPVGGVLSERPSVWPFPPGWVQASGGGRGHCARSGCRQARRHAGGGVALSVDDRFWPSGRHTSQARPRAQDLLGPRHHHLRSSSPSTSSISVSSRSPSCTQSAVTQAPSDRLNYIPHHPLLVSDTPRSAHRLTQSKLRSHDVTRQRPRPRLPTPIGDIPI